MTDLNETEYNFDDDVSLDDDEKNAGGTRDEWLKLSDKQIVRCAFVHFKSYDANAVKKATKDAKRALTREEQLAVAKQVLTKRAEQLGKKLEQLTAVERLDPSITHFPVWRANYAENGIGYVISRLGKDGPEADQVWKRLGDVKKYFSTLLLIYPSNTDGGLQAEAFAQQVKTGKLKLLPWRFGPGVYEDIFKLNDGLKSNGLSLAAQDIKLECKDAKFQKIAVQFGGASTWQKNEGVKNAVLSAALPLYDKLNPFREISTEKLREKLGLGPVGTPMSDEISSDNFKDLLDSV